MPIPPVLVSFAVGGVQDVHRAFDSIETRIIRAEQGATRASESSSKARVRAVEGEATQRAKLVDKTAVTHERTERQISADVDREVRRREAIHRRSSEMAGRLAAQQATAEIREAQRSATEIERIHERTRRAIGSSAARGITGAIGGIGSMAAGALTIGGGFVLADVARKQLTAERTAALIVNEVTANGRPAPGATVANIMGRTSQVAQETGMGKNEVQAGFLAYTKAAKGGDFGTAMENIGFFAKLAKVSGADISELATGAGMLQSENPNLKAADMRAMLLDMLAQGHAGSIPLADMAGLAGVVGSARGSFAGSATDNQRKLLGLTQLARSEAGGPEEAARGIKQMALEMERPKHAALLRQMGVRFNASGQAESPEQMLTAAISATGGNQQKLGEIFGARSGGLMRHLSETFRNAGGGAKGVSAMQEEMASVTKATTSPQDIEAQFQQMMTTPAEKFQMAVVKIEEAVANRLEPWLGRMADKLSELVPTIENVIEKGAGLAAWFADNPFSGLAAVVGGIMTKELVQAGIGGLLEKALTTKLGGGLSIITAEIALGTAIINILSEMQLGGQRGAVRETNEATNVAMRLFGEARSGTVAANDVAAAQAAIPALKAKLADQQAAASGSQWSMVSGMLGADDRRANSLAQAKATETALKQLETALTAATAAVAKHGQAVSAAPDVARSQPIAHPGRS